MKTRDEVIVLFRDKYEHLKAVYPSVGPFEENRLYQNPDGGWQMNLESCAAITLRPNDEEPYETHGAICAQWYKEGGAFNETGIPGWLGYPISDEGRKSFSVCPPCPMFMRIWKPPFSSVSGASSQFEFGTIEWHEELTWERANEHHAYDNAELILLEQGLNDASDFGASEEWFDQQHQLYDAAQKRLQKGIKPDPRALCMSVDDFAVPPAIRTELNERGKQHVPKDIDNALETLLSILDIHVIGSRSWSCDLHHSPPVGLEWKFHAKVKEYEEFSIVIERDGTDIHATMNARGKSSFLGGAKVIEKQFTIPNRFRAI